MAGYHLHSSGVPLSVSQKTGLRCRHHSGKETDAVYDTESNRVQCKMSDEFTTTDQCDLYAGSELVCKDSTCLHRRDDSSSSINTSDDLDTDKEAITPPPNTTIAEEGVPSVLMSLSVVDRFLSLWIIIVMVIGVVVGYYSAATQRALNSVQITTVSLPVAFGLWFMMYPVLIKVRYETFGSIFRKRDTYRQLLFSVAANWVSRMRTRSRSAFTAAMQHDGTNRY